MSILYIDILIGGKVADVITTKLFRNGGSLAVRIPAGWVNEGEITLSRNPISGDILISQKAGKMRALLEKLSKAEPVEDAVFDAGLERAHRSEDQSIFERQANQSVSD